MAGAMKRAAPASIAVSLTSQQNGPYVEQELTRIGFDPERARMNVDAGRIA